MWWVWSLSFLCNGGFNALNQKNGLLRQAASYKLLVLYILPEVEA